jgi:hypothetical protein
MELIEDIVGQLRKGAPYSMNFSFHEIKDRKAVPFGVRDGFHTLFCSISRGMAPGEAVTGRLPFQKTLGAPLLFAFACDRSHSNPKLKW